MMKRPMAILVLAFVASHNSAASQTVESPRIARFEREGSREGPTAVDRFERELRRTGTPLVEAVPGQPDRVLVTFVWFSDTERENVIVQSWLESRDVERRAMRRIGDSPVWYRSFAAPSGLTMGYLISPDDPRLTEESPEFDQVTSGWVTDPLNPRTAPGALGMEWSLIDIGKNPSSVWLDGPAVPDARLPLEDIESGALDVTIPVRIYLPPEYRAHGREEYPLLIFFDGFGFFEIDRVHQLAEKMIRGGEIEPAVIAFIYNPGATRNRDMSCYRPIHTFLADELLPMLRRRFRAGRSSESTIVAGRSRSALGAACAAYAMPGKIGNVISQSGAFWWAPEGEEYEWLARDLSRTERRPISFYLDAGLLEDGPNPETGLSMLTVSRHMRDVLRSKGYPLLYQEYAGGHDPVGWRSTLPDALRHFLGNSR